MRAFYSRAADAYFVVATMSLMAMAVLLLASALWDVATTIATEDRVGGLLDGIGLLIIGFAVIETARFIAEEELFRDKELRSATESRRSLTKFITIVVIAASLEALVMVFKTSRTSIPETIYPAALFIASMSALVALGAYQWLSSRINHPDKRDEPGVSEGSGDKAP
ncbi:MAG TPA: GNAT family acetyltransferase [Mesorhizobium sp.]|jgi:hypothetical protein|nr:GNAT family acetyltransferase [Mesorhizobium sp.]